MIENVEKSDKFPQFEEKLKRKKEISQLIRFNIRDFWIFSLYLSLYFVNFNYLEALITAFAAVSPFHSKLPPILP